MLTFPIFLAAGCVPQPPPRHAFGSMLTHIPVELHYRNSHSASETNCRCLSSQANPAEGAKPGGTPLYGPARVHQVQAIWARMEAKNRLATRLSAKRRKIEPSLIEFDGRGQLPAHIHSWLNENSAPAFTSAWAALALNFSTKTRAWEHKCAFQRNNCDHACYDSDAEAYSSI